MTPPTRRTIITTTTAMLLSGCISLNIGQEDNAPYPADLDHLDDILALGKTTLPTGATNITITPALKFANSYPGGWGYVIAYHAEPQPIRDHYAKYTGFAKVNIEELSDAKFPLDINDIVFTEIEHPLAAGSGNSQLILERPLGRCWLLIRGAPS